MAYYVKGNGNRVYAFATKQDALVYICDNLRYENSYGFVFSDKACKNYACTVQCMGYNIYNYYPKGRMSWDGAEPKQVDPADGTLFNPFKSRR